MPGILISKIQWPLLQKDTFNFAMSMILIMESVSYASKDMLSINMELSVMLFHNIVRDFKPLIFVLNVKMDTDYQLFSMGDMRESFVFNNL